MPNSPQIPSLSQVTGWEVEHLSQAATYWGNTASSWEDAFDRAAREMSTPGGTSWEGDGAESAQTRAATDRVRVRGAADDLRVASNVARNAAEEIDFVRRQVLNAVGEAHGQGFVVGEDLGVTDKYASSTPAELAGRLAQAQALASDIRTKAMDLIAVDQQLASQIVSATTGLADLVFAEAPAQNGRDNTVQAFDFSEAPPPPEPPGPRPPRGLPPEGADPPIAGDLTPAPASRPSEAGKGGQSLWDENGGEWRYFPGDKYHNPHWDFNPHNAPNSPWDNVPIGDLPPVKDNPIITGLPPWLENPAAPGIAGPPQNPLLAPFPGTDIPSPAPSAPLPSWGPVDMFPHINIPTPNPEDMENAGAAGTGVVAGGGLLALLYMIFVQN